MLEIPSLNKKIIQEYIEKWDDLEEHYIWQERLVLDVFFKYVKY